MTATTPEVVDRYLGSAEAGDVEALAGCFTADGTVLDEGVTYRGREEIAAWRVALASKYTYTRTITGSEPAGADAYRVTAHLVGDFPGGEADLAYRFTLRDGLIAALTIG